MARSRNIKPGFFRNEDLVELPFETRLLFIGLWTMADKEGRLEDRPKKIKIEVFPADSVDVPSMTHALAMHGFITKYKVQGKPYIQINNFLRHQSPHHKEPQSELPGIECADHEPESEPAVDTENTTESGTYASTSQARPMHEPSTDHAQDKKSASSPLIPDSGFLIPDSLQELKSGASDEPHGPESEIESDCPESPEPEPALYGLPTNRFKTADETYPITQTDLDEWAQLYPGVNLDIEIRKIIGWLSANPVRRKTRRGMPKFINSWLSRAQDNAPIQRGFSDETNQRPDTSAAGRVRENVRREREADAARAAAEQRYTPADPDFVDHDVLDVWP